jgi:hypothetical protein
VVARNLNPEKTIGRDATPDMKARLLKDNSGVHETRTLEGTPVVTVFHRAPESRWWVLIGMPRSELQWPTLRALTWLGISSLLWSALAVLAGAAGGPHHHRAGGAPAGRCRSAAPGTASE